MEITVDTIDLQQSRLLQRTLVPVSASLDDHAGKRQTQSWTDDLTVTRVLICATLELLKEMELASCRKDRSGSYGGVRVGDEALGKQDTNTMAYLISRIRSFGILTQTKGIGKQSMMDSDGSGYATDLCTEYSVQSRIGGSTCGNELVLVQVLIAVGSEAQIVGKQYSHSKRSNE